MTVVKTINNEDLFADVEQIIGDGGQVTMRVKGNSMRPFLRNDTDTVDLAPIEAGDIRKGMVVLFRYNGRHILHRIRKVNGAKLVIKGDGNYRLTEYSTRSSVAAYAESIGKDGRTIKYGSLRWRTLTFKSLFYKFIRTLRTDASRGVKKILKRKGI